MNYLLMARGDRSHGVMISTGRRNKRSHFHGCNYNGATEPDAQEASHLLRRSETLERRAKLNIFLHSQAGIFIAVFAFVKSSCRHGDGVGFFVFCLPAVKDHNRFQTMRKIVETKT